MEPKNVTRHELSQTLLDIEDWTAQLREFLELIPPDATIARVEAEIPIATVAEVDNLFTAESAAAAAGSLRQGDVAPLISPPHKIPVCPVGLAGGCEPGGIPWPEEVRARDTYRVMRTIEILAGACRVLLGKMDQDRTIRSVS